MAKLIALQALLALSLSTTSGNSLALEFPSLLPPVPSVPSAVSFPDPLKNLQSSISNAGAGTVSFLNNMTSAAASGFSKTFNDTATGFQEAATAAMNSTSAALASAADAAGTVGSGFKNASTAAAESAVNFSFLETISKAPRPGLDSVSQFISTSAEEPDPEKTGGFIVSTNVNDIQFLLFKNPNNTSEHHEIKYKNSESLQASGFDPLKPTKILIHGFQNNVNSTFPQNAKNSYLKSGQDLNVIIVDWGRLALPEVPVIAPIFYPLVVVNVWNTGVRVGEFVTWLKESQPSMSLASIHIVGFSLGSHVSGKAATDIKARFNQTVARVTALDPAGPQFYTGLFARKLTKDDATFVDAYHTNAGQLGIWQNVARVDFYLNGGTGPQPGCLGFDSITAVIGSLTKTISGTCSHGWATKLFSETIGSKEALRVEPKAVCACASLMGYKLRSCSCDAQVVLGEHIGLSTAGTYYLDYRFEDIF